MSYSFRAFIAKHIAFRMVKNGFRFDKDYRWGTTRRHRVVYFFVETVLANQIADRLDIFVSLHD